MDECLAIGVGMRVAVQIVVGIFLTGHQGIEVELHDVVPNILCIVHLHLEVLVGSLADDTFFFGIRDIGRIGGILGTTADIQVVIVLEASLAGNSCEPIGIIAQILLCCFAVDDVVGVHKLEFLAPLRERGIAIITDLNGCVALTALCGNQNHTVGTTGTIDGGCRGILQHVDRGDVLWCYRIQATLNTIYQNQRSQTTYQCGDTTQSDRRACLRVTAGVDHRQTGNLAFHEFCGVADLTSVEVLGLHGSHGRGDVAFALCAVTDDHHFVEQCVVFLECHIVAGCYLL